MADSESRAENIQNKTGTSSSVIKQRSYHKQLDSSKIVENQPEEACTSQKWKFLSIKKNKSYTALKKIKCLNSWHHNDICKRKQAIGH